MFLANTKKTAKSFISCILAIALILLSFQSLGVLTAKATTDNANAQEAMGIACVEDNFDSYADNTNIHEQNGWISQERAAYQAGVAYSSHQVVDGALKATDTLKNGHTTFVTMRSMADAAVNQRATVDILNLGSNSNGAYSNLHLRYMIVNSYTTSGFRPCPADNYFVSVSRQEMIIYAQYESNATSANYWWGNDKVKEITRVTFESGAYKDGHIYRVEFIAQGTNPTTLTATLYDISDDMRVVAKVSATDDTSTLQKAGTVGLSHLWNGETGREYTLFDNFKYEETDATLTNTQQSFDTVGTMLNGWNGPVNGNTKLTFNGDGILLQKLDDASNNVEQFEHEAAMMLPMSEAAVNQTVEVKYTMTTDNNASQGVGVYAHVQGQRPTDTNCYRANITFANTGTEAETVNLYVGDKLVATGTKDYGYDTADHRLILSTQEVAGGIKITVTSLKYENSAWLERVALEYIDTTSNLRGAGTAGFTIYKKYISSIAKIYNFNYNGHLENFDSVGSMINGWNGPVNANTKLTYNGDGILIQKTDSASNEVEQFEHEAAMMLPMSEAAINQSAEIKYTMASGGNKAKQGVAVYAHVQGQRPTDDNCYRASVTFGEDTNETETVNLYVGNTLVATGTKEYSYDDVDHRLVISTQKVGNGIKITVKSLKWENSAWSTRVTLEYTDTTSELRGAGTAGFTLYKQYNSSIAKIYNFNYNGHDETFGTAKTMLDGWNGPVNANTKLTFNSDGMLMQKTDSASNNVEQFEHEAAMMRPMSEAAVNQTVEIKYTMASGANKAKQGVGVYAHVQGERPTDDNCYRASITFGEDTYETETVNLYVGGELVATGTKEHSYDTADHRLILITQAVEEGIKITVKSLKYENSAWSTRVTLEYTDTTSELRGAGTAGFTLYKQYISSIGKFYFFDYNGERQNFAGAPEMGNGWSGPVNTNTNVTFNGDVILLQKNDTASNGTEKFEHEAAMMRPMSEAAINQTAEVKYVFAEHKENQGVGVYAHVQGDRPTDTNCYRASVSFSTNNIENDHYKETVKLYVGNTEVATGSKDYGYATAQHRLIISTQEVAGGIKITVKSLKWENETWLERVALEYTDTTSKLRGAGTAGFTLYKKWNSSIGKFYYFNYSGEEMSFAGVPEMGNGWSGPVNTNTNVTFDGDGLLLKKDADAGNNGTAEFVHEGAMMRPMSEAAVNQTVEVKYNFSEHKETQGVGVYAHVQGERPTDDNCYRASVTFSTNNTTNDHYKETVKLYVGNTEVATGEKDYGYATAQHRLILTTQEVEGGIKITVTSLKWESETWLTRVALEYTDTTSELQGAGTAGFTLYKKWNSSVGKFYYFNYSGEEMSFAGVPEMGNGWSGPVNTNTNVTFDGDGLLLKKDADAGNNGTAEFVHEGAMMRPMSEAAVNQTVEVKYNFSEHKETQGVGVYAHVQGDRPTDTNCYRASVTFSTNNTTNDHYKETVKLYVGNTEVATGEKDYGYATAQHRLILTTQEVTGGIKITVTSLKWENETWLTRVALEYTDTTSELQGAGTAGFTLYKKWNSSVGKFYYCNYSANAAVTTFNALEVENDYVLKNKYTTADRTDTFNESAVVDGSISSHSESAITESLNLDGAFVAYAINAETAGDYTMRAILKMSGADAADYANTAKYVTMLVNGVTYKLNFAAPLDTYSTTAEVSVALNAGRNMVYLFGPTAELTAKLPGLKVDYDKLYTSDGLTIVKGTFLVAGDANDDHNVDVRDLIRFKRFINNKDNNDINYGALGYLLEVTDSESWDATSFETLRSFILLMGTDDTTFDEKSWPEYTDPRSLNSYALIEDVEGGADEQALAMQKDIVNAESKVTAASVASGRKVYYISSINGSDSNNGLSASTPWKSPYKLKDITLSSGDVVLFERGSVFRQSTEMDYYYTLLGDTYNWRNNMIHLTSGVSYGAYGNGAKPVFNGSSYNYASSDITWTQYSGNIYKCELALQDAGNILFDDGTVGVKKSALADLAEGNDFYHDEDGETLYLYCAEGNPGEVFNNIEIGVKRPIFAGDDAVSNVKIDNISFKHCGAHAVDFLENNNNNTITNCEFAWIGGSYQSSDSTLRYGNAVQFWNDAANNTVDSCWVHDVYDAGLTFQGSNGSAYDTIAFTNNLIQRCCYSVEFFIKLPDSGTPSGSLKNITISGNIMQFAGYGFTAQRPEIEKASHINAWTTNVFDSTENVKIQQNIFDISKRYIIYWNSEDTPSNVTVSNNTYYHTYTANNVTILWGAANNYTSTSKSTLVEAVTQLGDNVAVTNKDTQINWLIK